MRHEPGQKVGDYEILEVLGAGGMGEVYRVRNVISDRVEAMKILLPDLVGQQDLAGRFLREIKVLAGLDHPNIASLRTAQHVGNQLVMIMELVNGTTLAHRLRGGSLSEHEAVDFTIQVLSALTYAHARGIVHRDIKPANMMLMPTGTIKLLDFGIASAVGETKLTQTGSTLGSVYYMSPEQVQGHALDTRSDLYSLGISLYEMITCVHPFEGDTGFTIMKGHMDGTFLPPRQVNPNISPALEEVVLRAMARQPDQRYQTADEFSAALEHVRQMAKADATIADAAAMAPTVIFGAAPGRPTVAPAAPYAPAAATPSQAETNTGAPVTAGPPAGIISPAAPAYAPPAVAAGTIPAAAPAYAPPAVAAGTIPPAAPASTPPAVAARAVAAGPPHVPSSKRALYMGLGAALTLVIIVLSAMRLPVFQGASSDSKSAAAAPANATEPPASATSTAPAIEASTPGGGGTTQPAAAVPSSALSSALSSAPSSAAPPAGSSAAAGPTSVGASSAAVAGRPAVGRATAEKTIAVAAAPKKAPEVKAAEPAQTASGESAKLFDEQDMRFIQMSARFAAVRTTYENLRRQQAASGYSPDPSYTMAVRTGDQYMSRADAALAARDGAGAKKYMDLADPQIAILEKAFGR